MLERPQYARNVTHPSRSGFDRHAKVPLSRFFRQSFRQQSDALRDAFDVFIRHGALPSLRHGDEKICTRATRDARTETPRR